MQKIFIIIGESYRKEVTREACEVSNLIKEMILDNNEPTLEIPLQCVSPKTMDKVIDYFNYHASNPPKTIEKPLTSGDLVAIAGEWDADFVKLDDDQETLIDLALAANYLDCKSLLDLCLAKIATMMREKDIDEVKKIFKIEDADMTAEEEKKIREENPWIFDMKE